MKSLLIILLSVLVVTVNAQKIVDTIAQKLDSTNAQKSTALKQKKDFYIERSKDLFTDKISLSPSKYINANDGKTGFIVSSSFKLDGNEAIFQGLFVTFYNLGSDCNEHNTLDILFDDGSKFNFGFLTGSDWNCDGYTVFDRRGKYFDQYNSKKVVAIRFTHGSTGHSYAHTLLKSEQTYFIEVKKALDTQNIVDVKKEQD